MDNRDLDYIQIRKGPNRQEIDINKESYLKHKANRPKGKNTSHKNATKKRITKKTLVAAMIAASTLTIVGTALNTGKHNIINNVIESGIDNSDVASISNSNGFIFIENGKEIDGETFIANLCTEGQEHGFTSEEMAIYCKYKYGVSGISEGVGKEIEAKFQSYVQFLNGNEQVEWRHK